MPVVTTRLVLWGDSRTEGFGATAPADFASFVASMLPAVAVTNAGRSGQTAAQVIARQGGQPALLTLANNMIAASGSTVVTAASVDIFFYAGTPMAGGSYAGSIAGVPGTYISDGAGNLTFARTTAGSAVALSGPTAFRLDLDVASVDAAMFLCVGRNGIATDAPADTVQLINAAINHLTAANRRYMIAGVMPDREDYAGTAARVPFDTLNALLASTYGDAYLDLVTPPTAAEMTAAGYTPTAADQTDISQGVFPRGMFYDSLHLLSAGQNVWAQRVAARVRARGWI